MVIVACLILTALLAAPVIAAPKAKAVQTPLFPVSGGSSDNVLDTQPSQGKVIVNTPNGNVTLIFNGIVTGLTPSTTYAVWVRDLRSIDSVGGYTGPFFREYAPLGYYVLDYFTTDEFGAGNFHINVRAEDLPADSYNIQVAINTYVPDANGVTLLATPKYTSVTTGG